MATLTRTITGMKRIKLAIKTKKDHSGSWLSSWPRSGFGTLSRRMSDDIAVSENMMNSDFDERKKKMKRLKNEDGYPHVKR